MMAYDSYKPACFMLSAIEYTLCTAIIAYRRLSHCPSTVLSTPSESYVRASPQSDVDHADHQLFDKSAIMAMLRFIDEALTFAFGGLLLDHHVESQLGHYFYYAIITGNWEHLIDIGSSAEGPGFRKGTSALQSGTPVLSIK